MTVGCVNVVHSVGVQGYLCWRTSFSGKSNGHSDVSNFESARQISLKRREYECEIVS
jgi:hypothetical protein